MINFPFSIVKLKPPKIAFSTTHLILISVNRTTGTYTENFEVRDCLEIQQVSLFKY